jgi:hypothetical protein
MLIFLLHRRTIELIILTGDLGGKPPSGRPVTSPEGSENGAQASSLNLAPASAGVFGAFQSECRHSDYLRRVLVGELLKSGLAQLVLADPMSSYVSGATIAVKRGNTTWSCRCDCGNEKIVQASHLRSGSTMSCGCLRQEGYINRGRKKLQP